MHEEGVVQDDFLGPLEGQDLTTLWIIFCIFFLPSGKGLMSSVGCKLLNW